MRQETLLFALDKKAGKILLAMKKVRFGAGKYNGMGGHIEEDETPIAAAVRETFEEANIVVQQEDAVAMGQIHFSFEDKPDWERLVHVFVAEKWEGEPKESGEMAPEWFALNNIPFDRMWIDDQYWLPLVLDGKVIDAEFQFNNAGSTILQQRIN
ncbi:MAG TPA: 8-oxo-dGTP diphosphatase [Candidatus Paceibacterota bacterium]|nr:8-oxo-dGTP diphosphatase [Candidatus Paceibacterota bacterium]